MVVKDDRAVEVIDGNIEKTLNLARVKVDRDDAINACRLHHICHELCRDRYAGSGFAVLARVAEIRHHSRYRASRAALKRVG